MRSVASEPNQARLVDSRQSSGSFYFPAFVLKQGAFAPPALPGFVTTTPPSAIRMGRLHLSRDRRCRGCHPAPARTSLVARATTALRAATTTPVEPLDAGLARFSNDVGLPRYYGESASTTTFRGLLSVHSRCGPQSSLTSFEAVSRSASAHSLPPGPLLVLPAGARVSRVGLAPTSRTCLCKAHTTTGAKTKSGLGLPAGKIGCSLVLCELASARRRL